MDICQSGALIICQDEEEREKKKCHNFNFADTAVLCCHPAADSGTATSAFLLIQILIPIFN